MELNEKCDIKMTQFKQSFLKKYDNDISEFTNKMNEKIGSDTEKLKESLEDKC